MEASDSRGGGQGPGGSEASPRDRAQPARAGALYVVATPLGNLRDLTLRAIDVLRSADRIAAEDTRVTAKLLAHLGIATRPFSVRAQNEAARAAEIAGALGRGESVALVTDAGTPGVSDPGARVVRAVRDAGHPVVPVPGPSAVAAAVSIAGLSAERFAFVGFLPAQSKARRALLASLAPLPMALVIYEAPHRVRETAAELAAALGPDRELVVARELTKAFETVSRLPLAQAADWFAGDAHRERGEFVLLVDAPRETSRGEGIPAEAAAWLDALLRELPPARAARIVAERTGASRDALYERALGRREDGPR